MRYRWQWTSEQHSFAEDQTAHYNAGGADKRVLALNLERSETLSPARAPRVEGLNDTRGRVVQPEPPPNSSTKETPHGALRYDPRDGVQQALRRRRTRHH